MANLIQFPSLVEALRANFQVCERREDGYLVRAHTDAGWAVAFVPANHRADSLVPPTAPGHR